MQMTVYDVRISDWSSGVCSSDLRGGMVVDADRRHVGGRLPGGDGDGDQVRRLQRVLHRLVVAQRRRQDDAVDPAAQQLVDRKRVLWGMRVSVRVDLGVRWISQKKKLYRFRMCRDL